MRAQVTDLLLIPLLRQGLVPADTRGVGSMSHLPAASQSASQLFPLPHEPISRQANPSTIGIQKNWKQASFLHGGDFDDFCDTMKRCPSKVRRCSGEKFASFNLGMKAKQEIGTKQQKELL
jgi:hypothetical protein